MFENDNPSAEVVQRIRQEERTRFAAIMALPEAMGREVAAGAFAAEGLSVEAAKRALALIPLSAVGSTVVGATGTLAGTEIGPGGAPAAPSAEAIRAGWKSAMRASGVQLRG